MIADTGGALPSLPERARLVHVGPPGAGTTVLQGAFLAASAAALDQGVGYAAARRRWFAGPEARFGRPPLRRGTVSPALAGWAPLLADVRRSRAARLVISRELLADAGADDIRRIVADLDPARVHVAVTLEPLARILPRQWQQDVIGGERRSYVEWLTALLTAQPGPTRLRFWRRFRHDQLLSRWGAVVGPERVTAMVVDEHDPDRVLRAFERLVGLRDRTLAVPADREPRLLTLPEIEAVRAFNVACSVEGIEPNVQRRVVSRGAARELRRAAPPDDAPPIEMPPWASDRTATIAREIVVGIRASGARVVGDLDTLVERPAAATDVEPLPSVIVPTSVAASLAMGIMYASGLASEERDRPAGRRPVPSAPTVRPEPIELVRVPTRALVGILVRRGTAVAASTVRMALGRLRRLRPVS